MMTLNELRMDFTTAGGGAVTTTIDSVFGLLYAIEWVDGTLDDGGTAVFSCINTMSGVTQTLVTLATPLVNADAWYYPRVATHDTVGAADGGTDYAVLNGRIQMALTAGGAVTTGACVIYYWTP